VIKEFIVYNRETIESIEPHDVPHVIVSIRSPKDPNEAILPIGPNTLGIVRLVFHDMDDFHKKALAPEKWEKYEADCFSTSHARQILELVKDHPSAERLLVHCDAGFSRSPAVAAALSKILTGDDTYFFKHYAPNMRVFRTILETHYGD
jgi:predicted protein tyrosine phosphatase